MGRGSKQRIQMAKGKIQIFTGLSAARYPKENNQGLFA